MNNLMCFGLGAGVGSVVTGIIGAKQKGDLQRKIDERDKQVENLQRQLDMTNERFNLMLDKLDQGGK